MKFLLILLSIFLVSVYSILLPCDRRGETVSILTLKEECQTSAAKLANFFGPKAILHFLVCFFRLLFCRWLFSLKKVNGKCKQKRKFSLWKKKKLAIFIAKVGTPPLKYTQYWRKMFSYFAVLIVVGFDAALLWITNLLKLIPTQSSTNCIFFGCLIQASDNLLFIKVSS